MAYVVKYQDDTNTYQIKHANSCEHCKHKSGNSLAVMKVVIDDDGNPDYTVKFKEILSLSQIRQLLPFLEQYVEEVIEEGRY